MGQSLNCADGWGGDFANPFTKFYPKHRVKQEANGDFSKALPRRFHTSILGTI